MTTSRIIALASLVIQENLNHTRKGDSFSASLEVLGTYLRSRKPAHAVANWVRAQGCEALGTSGPEGSAVRLVPTALADVIGRPGKHGSMMSDELGSCLRMSCVPADMSMVSDAPHAIGVDEFCANYRLCTAECPPGALVDTKQVVRGARKWYVDFDKCVPYFNDHDGCTIRLAAYPPSRPCVAKRPVPENGGQENAAWRGVTPAPRQPARIGRRAGPGGLQAISARAEPHR